VSITVVVGVLLVLLMVGFVVLILLWAFTEELPRASRVPYYERMEPGNWAVRLEKAGRRKTRTMRLVNEVVGGDIVRAREMTEHPPSLIVDGVSESLAHEIVSALREGGAEAVAIPAARDQSSWSRDSSV
jgi:hypothetical protein